MIKKLMAHVLNLSYDNFSIVRDKTIRCIPITLWYKTPAPRCDELLIIFLCVPLKYWRPHSDSKSQKSEEKKKKCLLEENSKTANLLRQLSELYLCLIYILIQGFMFRLSLDRYKNMFVPTMNVNMAFSPLFYYIS